MIPRRLLLSLVWFAAALVIAFGAAGLITAMDTGGRADPEADVAAPGDAAAMAALDAIEADIASLEADVDALGVQSRGALASLVGGDQETVATAITTGDAIMAEITRSAVAIDDALDTVPGIDAPDAEFAISEAVHQRHARLREARRAVDDLPGAWSGLSTGAFAASRLSSALAAHDDAVLAAAALGRDAKYEDAMAALDGADSAIADARELSKAISDRVDVAVLEEWLDRNATYDTALRALYAALDDVGGRVTEDVREAIDAERAAKDQLPPDARGLILIMSDIGRGWMNGAVIAIEEARGRLSDALAPPAPRSPSASAASP